jgi:hypothetical protein
MEAREWLDVTREDGYTQTQWNRYGHSIKVERGNAFWNRKELGMTSPRTVGPNIVYRERESESLTIIGSIVTLKSNRGIENPTLHRWRSHMRVLRWIAGLM